MNRIVMELTEEISSFPFLVWRKNNTVSLKKPEEPTTIDAFDKYNDKSYYKPLKANEVLYDIPETQKCGIYTEICNNGLIACYDRANNLLIVYDLLKTATKSFADIQPKDIGVSVNPMTSILVCKRDKNGDIYTEPRILIDGGEGNKWGLVDMSTDSFNKPENVDDEIFKENGLFNLPSKITDFHFKAKPFILFKGLPKGTVVKIKEPEDKEQESVIVPQIVQMTDELYYFYNYSGLTEFVINFRNTSNNFKDFIMEVS